MKKLVKINDRQNIDLYSSLCDGFIVGLKDFSVDFDSTFSCEEIEKLISCYSNKEIFVSVNKNIFNNELKELENVLFLLNKLRVKVLFYDMAVLYLKRKNNLDLELVWNQTHMVTNYNTCNYYYDKGCHYALVSGEITLDEIVEMQKNTKSSLLVQVVGHQIMSFSRRKLLTNFYKSIKKEYDSNLKEISDHDKKYLIKETKDGTSIKTFDILNGTLVIPELLACDISYIVIDESYIDKEIITEVLKIVDEMINNKNIDENISKSISLLGNNTSFFFKKTIYKVKKSEV